MPTSAAEQTVSLSSECRSDEHSAEGANAVPAHLGVLQQALKDGPCVGVGHGRPSVMARVEAALRACTF
eukprot:scaffold11568_cov57-Phaeocystis_antarctica.AAC.1